MVPGRFRLRIDLATCAQRLVKSRSIVKRFDVRKRANVSIFQRVVLAMLRPFMLKRPEDRLSLQCRPVEAKWKLAREEAIGFVNANILFERTSLFPLYKAMSRECANSRTSVTVLATSTLFPMLKVYVFDCFETVSRILREASKV